MLMLGLLHQFEAFLRLIIGFSYVFVLLIFPRQKVVGAHIYIFSMCRSKEYSELFVQSVKITSIQYFRNPSCLREAPF